MAILTLVSDDRPRVRDSRRLGAHAERAVPGDEVKAFLLSPADPVDLRVEGQGVVCRCLEEKCAGRWPTMEGHLLRSPANPYQCDAMFKLNGRWRLEAKSQW